MEQKIIAVIVTYNRLQYLPLVIDALKHQTFPVHKIIVVNNGSTGNTKQWLDEQDSIHSIHQTNVGGSGGFHTGVKAAFEDGAEWVWMMDDDVVPDVDCLEKLWQYTSVSSCLHPVHLYADGAMQEEERWFNPADCSTINYFNASFNGEKKIWFRNTGSFEGMLIARDIVKKIGFPDIRFFLFHDDLIYGWLAHKHTNTCVVAEAIMRKLPIERSEGSTDAYIYYAFRNFWLLEEYVSKEVKGLNGYRKRRIRLQFFYEVYKMFFVDKPQDKLNALRTLLKAYKDYKQKKAGRR